MDVNTSGDLLYYFRSSRRTQCSTLQYRFPKNTAAAAVITVSVLFIIFLKSVSDQHVFTRELVPAALSCACQVLYFLFLK